MSRMERDKGRKAEADVRRLYVAAGFEVRGLEGVGDHLVIGHGLTIHSEVKRQEVLRLPLWSRQAIAEAPRGALPIVSYRRSREPWRALAPASWCTHYFAADAAERGWSQPLLLNREWWECWLLEELLLRIVAQAAGADLLALSSSAQEAT